MKLKAEKASFFVCIVHVRTEWCLVTCCGGCVAIMLLESIIMSLIDRAVSSVVGRR